MTKKERKQQARLAEHCEDIRLSMEQVHLLHSWSTFVIDQYSRALNLPVLLVNSGDDKQVELSVAKPTAAEMERRL